MQPSGPPCAACSSRTPKPHGSPPTGNAGCAATTQTGRECGRPVESEPCLDHSPATVVRRLADENRQLRDRIAALEADTAQIRSALDELWVRSDDAGRLMATSYVTDAVQTTCLYPAV